MGRTVGMRELKTRLGEYLRLVDQGESLVVTVRGRAVAEIRPFISAVEMASALSAGLTETEVRTLYELRAQGQVSFERLAPMPPVTPLSIKGGPIAQTVSEEREEGW